MLQWKRETEDCWRITEWSKSHCSSSLDRRVMEQSCVAILLPLDKIPPDSRRRLTSGFSTLLMITGMAWSGLSLSCSQSKEPFDAQNNLSPSVPQSMNQRHWKAPQLGFRPCIKGTKCCTKDGYFAQRNERRRYRPLSWALVWKQRWILQFFKLLWRVYPFHQAAPQFCLSHAVTSHDSVESSRCALLRSIRHFCGCVHLIFCFRAKKSLVFHLFIPVLINLPWFL